MSKDQRRAQTKKALLDALVICLEDQDFNDITTIRLVQTAGISRSSFYTHYKDKYEMIDSYQKELFHKLEYIFDKYEGKKEGAFLEIFEFLTREKLLSALLSTNGSKEIQDFLIHKLQRMIAEDFIDPTAEELSKDSRKTMPVFILRMLFLALVKPGQIKEKKNHLKK